MRRAEEGGLGAWPGPRTALRSRAGAPEGLVDLEAPWRVSVPSSCKGALKLARARRRGAAWASWVSKSSATSYSRIFSSQKVPLRII